MFLAEKVPDNQHCAAVQASKSKAPASGTPDDIPVRKVQRTSSAKGRGSRLSHTASAAAEEAAAAAAAETGDHPAGAGEAALGQAAAAAHEAAAGLDAAASADAPAAGDRAHKLRKRTEKEAGLACAAAAASGKHVWAICGSLLAACLVLCTCSLCGDDSLVQLLIPACLQQPLEHGSAGCNIGGPSMLIHKDFPALSCSASARNQSANCLHRAC